MSTSCRGTIPLIYCHKHVESDAVHVGTISKFSETLAAEFPRECINE
uniref:Uncharacterized protein n=1 Tax=Arundo donax TaxID=35708 RepID=A0A0A8ZUT7_ARUDO